jgi:hypothetical protein
MRRLDFINVSFPGNNIDNYLPTTTQEEAKTALHGPGHPTASCINTSVWRSKVYKK